MDATRLFFFLLHINSKSIFFFITWLWTLRTFSMRKFTFFFSPAVAIDWTAVLGGERSQGPQVERLVDDLPPKKGRQRLKIFFVCVVPLQFSLIPHSLDGTVPKTATINLSFPSLYSLFWQTYPPHSKNHWRSPFRGNYPMNEIFSLISV